MNRVAKYCRAFIGSALSALLVTLIPGIAFAQDTVSVECETGTLTGVASATAITGFTGAGYVSGFDAETDTLTLNYNVGHFNPVKISVRYNSETAKKCYVLIDTVKYIVMLPATGATEWETISFYEYNVGYLDQTIKFGFVDGGFNLDKITVEKTESYSAVSMDGKDTIALEAEDGLRLGVNELSKPLTGFSGTGYVAGVDTLRDTLILSFNANVDTSYELLLKYSAASASKIKILLDDIALTPNLTATTGNDWATLSLFKYPLKIGDHKIKVFYFSNGVAIDKFIVKRVPFPAAVSIAGQDSIKVELEGGLMYGLQTSSDTTGFSGNGYVSGFVSGVPSRVGVAVTFDSSSYYEVGVRYKLPFSGPKEFGMWIGDLGAGSTFKVVDGEAWSTVAAYKSKVNAGTHWISIGPGWGYFYVDCITIKRIPPPPPVVMTGDSLAMEVENAYLAGVSVGTTDAGFSGTGYVFGFDDQNDNLIMRFTTSKKDVYHVSVRYTSQWGPKKFSLSINDASLIGDMDSSGAGDWKTYKATLNDSIPAGTHTLTITSNYGYYIVDKVDIIRGPVPVGVINRFTNHVKFNVMDLSGKIDIFNIQGRIVASFQGNGTMKYVHAMCQSKGINKGFYVIKTAKGLQHQMFVK
jgi:hypothetical protein